jgi:molybdopterin converting factor small subunit
MKIKLIAFGIAKEIIGPAESDLEVKNPCNIGDLKRILITQYHEFKKLQSIKFAINEDYQEDQFQIHEGDEVVIIPPVSGG